MHAPRSKAGALTQGRGAHNPARPRLAQQVPRCLRCGTEHLQQQLISLTSHAGGQVSRIATTQHLERAQQQQQQQYAPWQLQQWEPQLALAAAAFSDSSSMSQTSSSLTNCCSSSSSSSSGMSAAGHHSRRGSKLRNSHMCMHASGRQAPSSSSSSQEGGPPTSSAHPSAEPPPAQQQQQPPLLDGFKGITASEQRPQQQQQQQQQEQTQPQEQEAAAAQQQEAAAAAAEQQEGLDTPGVRAALAALKWYKGFLSPSMASTCRFQPTCSQYSMDSYKKYGVAKGTVLTAWRLLRCNPWGGQGYDPTNWPPVGLPASLFSLPYSAEVAVLVGTAAFLRFSHALLFE